MENNANDKSLYPNILKVLADAFNTFVKTFKKNGLATSAVIMILFIILWTFIINPIRIGDIIERKLEMQYEMQQKQQTEITQELIERRYEANDVIGGIMSKILSKYNCSRVLLLEKHNSMQSLGKVDFLYLSASIELINPDDENIKYMTEDLQRQVVYSLLGADINTLLRHNEYLYLDSLNTHKRNGCRLINKLVEQGENEVILYPFLDKKKRPLLIMVICGDDLKVNEIVEYIHENSKQISDLLIFN